MKTIIFTLTLLAISVVSNAQTKNKNMETLYYTKIVNGTYDEVFAKIESGLKEVGFGIVTQVALHEKIKAKLDKSMPIYQLLGVCSPSHAYTAVSKEENIGLFLPCKVIVKEKGDKIFEVVSINAREMMGILGNDELTDVATEVDNSLKQFMDNL